MNNQKPSQIFKKCLEKRTLSNDAVIKIYVSMSLSPDFIDLLDTKYFLDLRVTFATHSTAYEILFVSVRGRVKK